jgi:hypothetical protein
MSQSFQDISQTFLTKLWKASSFSTFTCAFSAWLILEGGGFIGRMTELFTENLSERFRKEVYVNIYIPEDTL